MSHFRTMGIGSDSIWRAPMRLWHVVIRAILTFTISIITITADTRKRTLRSLSVVEPTSRLGDCPSSDVRDGPLSAIA